MKEIFFVSKYLHFSDFHENPFSGKTKMSVEKSLCWANLYYTLRYKKKVETPKVNLKAFICNSYHPSFKSTQTLENEKNNSITLHFQPIEDLHSFFRK